MSEKNTVEQAIVEDMRKILIATGQLSTTQEQTLKMWSLIAFSEVSSVEIKYDLSKYTKTLDKQDHYITFMVNSNCQQDMLEARCQRLADYCRSFFWPELNVFVFINNKEVFSSLYKEKPQENQDGLITN